MTEEQQQQVEGILRHLELMRQYKRDGVTGDDVMHACDEAMETWGPLAESIGMTKEQHEMLDMAVELGYPEDYKELKRLMFESEAMCENVFKTFSLPIRSMLDDLGIEYTFLCRMKSVYSVWRKMRVKGHLFDEVYDIFATRIIYKPKPVVEPLSFPNELDQSDTVKAVSDKTYSDLDAEKLYCWRVYSVVSALYRINPDRIHNYIDHPKPSGYQALQLTVMGPDCNWIELQIRSERMDYVAEHGSASHALYKKQFKVK